MMQKYNLLTKETRLKYEHSFYPWLKKWLSHRAYGKVYEMPPPIYNGSGMEDGITLAAKNFSKVGNSALGSIRGLFTK